MASHRRPKPASRMRVTVLTATAAAAVALSSQAANAAPAKESVKDAKSKVDALYSQAEQATQKYDAANEKLSSLQKDASNLQDQVARQQETLNKLRDSIGVIAASQYRSGGIDPSLQLFLSSNPDDYLAQASSLDQITSLQAGALTQLENAKQTLDQERAEATAKLAEVQSTRADLAKNKADAKAKLAKAQGVLNGLTAAQRAAMQQQDLDAANRASSRVDLGNSKAATALAQAAFNAAKTKIGDPYYYGATGPSQFDCSGLTSWAYAQAGASIPRTSEEQANAGTRIYSASQLGVGDLVIFYGDYHHVGLYAGNGMVLHAPKPGAVVRYEAMSDMPFEFGVRI
ncbi:Cell wall-associated hydrolase, NlpC family [Actinacidiphila yanglinensis]|uniref:Cell wall-associated hydrolase, NlpC family n=1 Tax=Actinacidiphila yanglinensis TaxID=310779 RepID=A0A1H5TEQ8_9ACTN|nr:C40 family peptidase [Actinacidiphila yanglinensis]SEF61243.1 Cell wall-associated hydrolase, NlpC family [Actinacidiphila yanglinensis]